MARSRTWRRYRGWIAAGVLVAIVVAVLLVMRSAKATEQPETTYTTSAAETGTLQVTVSGTGNLELASTTDVSPDAAGTVDSIEVEEGQSVKRGEVLFTLDPDDAEAAANKALASYRQAQSGVAQASAQVLKAQASLDDLEERSGDASSAVTDADIDLAQAELESAMASLSSAKTQRSNALDDYDDALEAKEDLEVTAPASGIVYSIDVEEGDAVTSGDSSGADSANGSTANGSSASSGSSAPVVIASTAPLVATLSVNEVDLPSLELGQRADLEFDALPDLALTGKVTGIADEGSVDQGVVSFDVEITLDVKNKQLKPGMSVSATIVTAVARDVLLVPNAAVKSDDSGSYVQVLDATTRQPTRVDVEVGLAGDTQTQIVSGLSEGDEVVTATNDSSDTETQTGARPGGGMMIMGGGPR